MGVLPENVYYCRERIDKAAITTDLHITHFIDDRREVIGYLQTVKHTYLFRPKGAEVRHLQQHLKGARIFHAWKELTDEILKLPSG